MSLLERRRNYKPFEYPEVTDFTEAIQKAYWVHDEVDFTADIQDFNVTLTKTKKTIHKRSILSIAQTEVEVKGFWGDLYKHFPKPELNGLGATFAESEFRHSEAYSRILTVNGFENDFIEALRNPVFDEYNLMVRAVMQDNTKTIIEKIIFFTLVIEDSSLFSKFANILSFTRFDGIMKNTANIIAWTSIDEQIHSKAGIWLINKLKEEGLFPSSLSQQWVHDSVGNYMNQESNMLDWIFEDGESEHYTKEQLLTYMKSRLDNSLKQVGFDPIFQTTAEDVKPFLWFEEEIHANTLDDFFAKRPVEYTKHDKPVTAKDLF